MRRRQPLDEPDARLMPTGRVAGIVVSTPSASRSLAHRSSEGQAWPRALPAFLRGPVDDLRRFRGGAGSVSALSSSSSCTTGTWGASRELPSQDTAWTSCDVALVSPGVGGGVTVGALGAKSARASPKKVSSALSKRDLRREA